MTLNKLVLLLLLSAMAESVLAQYQFSAPHYSGSIGYYGTQRETLKYGRMRDFGIGTSPSSGGMDSKSTYYIQYPMSVQKTQTNLEYYPGAKAINLSFSLDTAYCNVSDMRYCITDTDSSVNTGWSPLPKGRWVPQGGTETILFVDDFACNDKVLFIKLYNINDPESVITQIVNTRQLNAPQIQFRGIIRQTVEPPKSKTKTENDFFKQFKPVDLKGLVQLTAAENFSTSGVAIYTKSYPFFFKGYLIRNLGGKKDTVDLALNWERLTNAYLEFWTKIGAGIQNLPDPSYTAEIPAGLINSEGKYTVLITTADYKNEMSKANLIKPVFASSSFEISRQYMFKLRDVLLGAGITAVFTIACIMLLKYMQRKKIRREKRATKEAKLSLQAVQSQLNPHFIFNALAGIQNLLNRQDNENADRYLTTFSRLTRRVLQDADKELISLNDEVKLLKDYLQMEQLRFRFQYTFSIDPGIDLDNVEIPPMLLQPLAENAVKHGVAYLDGKGLVEISIQRNAGDLVIKIKDNGKGFKANIDFEGKGLLLSKNRISLLNTLYPKLFNFHIASGDPGSIITITIKNWLK